MLMMLIYWEEANIL